MIIIIFPHKLNITSLFNPKNNNNILVKEGVIKISDFGSLKQLNVTIVTHFTDTCFTDIRLTDAILPTYYFTDIPFYRQPFYRHENFFFLFGLKNN